MNKVNKSFASDNSSSYDVTTIGYEFTDIDKARIKKCQKLIKNNPFISQMRIDIDGDVKFYDDEGEEVHWRTNIIQLIVFSNSIYIYTEHKHNSGDYFESEEINLD